MEEKLIKKRLKDNKVFALVKLPLNTDPYVIRVYDEDGLLSASKFQSKGKSLDSLDRLTE